MKNKVIFCFALCLVLLVACSPYGNNVEHVPNVVGNVAGFWLGLWHGIIAPITFFLSLFMDSVNIYEVHNNGGWYNFGFFLGLGSSVTSSTKASSGAGGKRKE